MEKEKKIFSIVIPAYNAESTILRTLASLISSRDYIKEVIVVNDHSTDGTIEQVEILKDILPIQILNNEGEQNPGAARKTGLLAAQGEWIAFVDADDCLTASALHYVVKELNDELLLLHTKTMYYEFGTLVPDNIDYQDNSCGGNYYRRQFLIDNKLLPHDTLKMSEDEYFNKIIYTFMKVNEIEDSAVSHYDYPTYEVHHDDGIPSLALGNWLDYIIKYHLLSEKYHVEFFANEPKAQKIVIQEFIHNFIFGYFCLMCSIQDEDFIFDADEQFKYFRDSLDFFKEKFSKDKNFLIRYYNRHPETIEAIKQAAIGSTGVHLDDDYYPFKYFINSL